MRNATSVIVPDEILNYVLLAFNRKEERSHKTGCRSFIHDFAKAISNFIDDNEERFPLLKVKFFNGVSEDHVKRVFNYKSPHGATKDLRNALALYASDGEHNWNQLIETRFPSYNSLLDKQEQPEDQHLPHISNYEIYLKLIEIENRFLKK